MFDIIRKSQTLSSFLPDTILSTLHLCGPTGSQTTAVMTVKGQNMICKYSLRSLSQY